jgi:murein DD-endopeptidase MepM/ murein hydrolase activator NlpD
MKGERIRILVLRDLTGESWQIGIPLRLFHFLLVALVVLVILTGATITWLGSIAIKLQAAEMVTEENQKLRQQLDRVGLLQEELHRIEEREKALTSLTQSFLDDPTAHESSASQAPSTDLYDQRKREAFVADVRADIQAREVRHRAGNDTLRLPLLLPPLRDWEMALGPNSEIGPGKRNFLSASAATIRSPLDGVVSEAGWSASTGLDVKLLLLDGWECELSELGEIDVQTGDVVRRGEPIGKTQRAGGESSSHFVVALSFHGLAIDPWFAMMR